MFTHTIVVRFDDTTGPEIHKLYPEDSLSEENALRLGLKLAGVISQHSAQLRTINYIDCPFQDYKCSYISLLLRDPKAKDSRIRTYGRPAIVAMLFRDDDYEKMVDNHRLTQELVNQQLASLKTVDDLDKDDFLRQTQGFKTPQPFHHVVNLLVLERTAMEAEEKYRKLVERAPIYIDILQDGFFRFVNSRFAQALGYTVEEMTSPDFRVDQILCPDVRDVVRERTRRREAGMNEIEQYDSCLLTRDGRKISVLVNATTIEYEGKMAIQAVLLDVTDIREKEAQIRQLKEFNETLIREAAFGIWAVGTDDRTILVNPALERMLGYSQEEMVGRRATEFIAPESLQRYNEVVESRYSGRVQSSNYELEFVAKDGRRVVCRVGGSLLRDGEGKLIGTLGILQEISRD